MQSRQSGETVVERATRLSIEMGRRWLYVIVAIVLVTSQIYLSLSSLNSTNSELVDTVDRLHLNRTSAGLRNKATSASKVHFRDFTADPKYHNKTVTGETIPGPFFDDQLFFTGARLTTSFIPNNTQVHVDLFGFPGDRLVVVPDSLVHCDPTNVSKAWKLRSHATLYCQLECKRGDAEEPNDCGKPILMRGIEAKSGDANQDGLALIWRCDVSKYLTKPDLLLQAAAGGQSSVRVRLLLNESANHTALIRTVTQVDIPLHTAVVGYGGPTIRHSELGYFSPQQQASPINVGLCLTAYGRDAHRYFLEFVFHHLNVGFSHIVLGIIANMDSEDLILAEQVLQPFIDSGVVSIQAIGLDDYSTCDTDVTRVQFYNQCLYHFKGLSEYSAAWDLDEYWMPPVRLEISGTSTFAHEHQGGEKVAAVVRNDTEALKQQRFIERSDISKFSPLVTNDLLWRESNYSKSISIFDVIKAIEQYHAMNHNCGGKWCYTLFPSVTVHEKKDLERTHRIWDDFDARDAVPSTYWQKSITRTQIAMTGGIHLPGSCQFPNDPDFYAFAKDKECYPHVWEAGEFGIMHHIMSLIVYRELDMGNVTADEVVMSFARTVAQQVDRLHESGSISTLGT